MDKFTQLVDDLNNNKITLTMVQIAIRAHIRDRKDLPKSIRGLLAGTSDSHAGLIYDIFRLIPESIGITELSYRRGTDNKPGE